MLFLAIIFTATAVAEGLVAINASVTDPRAHVEVINFDKMVLLAASKTYGIRMAGVFMVKSGLTLKPTWQARGSWRLRRSLN